MLAALLMIFALQDPHPAMVAPPMQTLEETELVTETPPETPAEAEAPAETPPVEVPPIPTTAEPNLADALTCQTVTATLGAGFGERAASDEGTERDAQVADYLTHLAERARQDARQRARGGMTEADLDTAMAEASLRRGAAADDGERAQAELTRCATLYRVD